MTISLAPLAAASVLTTTLLLLAHEVMRSDVYRDVHITVRYTVGIICGMVGAALYGLLTEEWLLLVGLIVLFCPGGALVIARYGLRTIERTRGRQQAQKQAWIDELRASETRED